MSAISPRSSEISVSLDPQTDSCMQVTVVYSSHPREFSTEMTREQLSFSQTLINTTASDPDGESPIPANSRGRDYSGLIDRIEKMSMQGVTVGPVERTDEGDDIDLSAYFPESPVAKRRFERLCSVGPGPRERPFPPLQLKKGALQRSNALTEWED